MNIEVEIRELPEISLYAITHIGEFEKTMEIYGQLMEWAKNKGLLDTLNFKTATIYHDNPRITPPQKTRWSACIVKDKDVAISDEVRLITIQKGQYAVSVNIDPTLIAEAWREICVWVKENNYKFGDRDYFELYDTHQQALAGQKNSVEIYIPIK